MSAQPESIGAGKSVDRVDAAPQIEYKMVTHDSLSMFLAAIGGAVLGMLLTLLVLALVNGGTLSFSGPRITQLEEYVGRVNENLGAVSANIDLVSEQAATLQQQLGSVEEALRGELENQGSSIETLNSSVETLNVTRQQFGLFMNALDSALADMQAIDPNAVTAETPGATTDSTAAEATTAETAVEETAGEAAPTDEGAPAEAADETTVLPAPQSMASSDVPADAIAVVIFVDNNSDGALSEGETNLIGIPVSLLNSDGESLATQESSDAGVLFSALDPGSYEVTVDDTMGYSLLSESSASVALGEEATEGMVVYIPVAAE
ncbi:MAG: hypothetical protein KDE53_20955 [Caldilineaceae bacterium]|nr:hypothetical protein [Caldilineaceae bacterium]